MGKVVAGLLAISLGLALFIFFAAILYIVMSDLKEAIRNAEFLYLLFLNVVNIVTGVVGGLITFGVPLFTTRSVFDSLN